MSGHATAESLSRYLDAALEVAERRRVEGHLEACPECRRRLDGLRRVVAGLGRLHTAVPPEDLAARVSREIDLRGRRGPWHRLLERGLPAPLGGSPPIHVLALVLALGAIVYLFAVGLERQGARSTRIVPVSAESVVVGGPPTDPMGQPAAVDGGERLYLLGGRFSRREGVWVEEGLGGRTPDTRVQLRPPPAAAEMAEVGELVALGAPLRMWVGEEVVEIAFEPTAPQGDS